MLNHVKPDQQGFTLVELLVTLAVTLIIIASLAGTFVLQQKTYNAQQQVNEMVQNARAAMDLMSREMMMTGYGVATNALPLSNWLTWGSVTFGNDPVVIEDGAGDGVPGNSDIIHVAGCFDGPVATLSAAVSAPATTITVTPIDSNKSTNDLFNIFGSSDQDKSNICLNGIESAVVTAISGNTLTIDTDPNKTGNQGLSQNYDATSTTVNICVVKIITYEIVLDDDGSYTLKRDENRGGHPQPLAENIIYMKATEKTSSGKTLGIEIDPLTAQTDKPDPDYSQNNGRRTFKLRSVITPPNLGYRNKKTSDLQ